MAKAEGGDQKLQKYVWGNGVTGKVIVIILDSSRVASYSATSLTLHKSASTCTHYKSNSMYIP